jgi:hypothetical protein
MIEKRIPIEGVTALTLMEMAGDVALSGWNESDVLIRLEGDSEENLTIEQTETGPAVSARVACEVHVPGSLPVTAHELLANLQVEGVDDFQAGEVRGSAHLSQVSKAVLAEISGNLKTEAVASLRVTGTVYGNATVRDGATVEMQNVRGNVSGTALDSLNAARISGNLSAKEIGGPLTVERVGGNATLRAMDGGVTLEKVSGNLTLKGLTAGAKVGKIGGNLLMNGEIGTGCTYQFKTGGNALLRLSEEASAHLTLTAKGTIRSSVTLTDSEQQGTTMTGTLGEGGAEIVVEADGNILVGTTGTAYGAGLGEEISRQIEDSLRAIDLEAVGEQISAEMDRAMSQLRAKLESVDWDSIGQRTQRSVERAIERMQRDIERMTEKAARRQEKLERMAERAAREKERMERTGQKWADRPQWRPAGMTSSVSSEADEPKPNLDQERLAILKMVEQGKINSEEAERLLDALQ